MVKWCRIFIWFCCLLPAHSYAQQAGIAAGTVLEVPLADLRPTQSVIAHEQVNYKLAVYRGNRQQLFADLCKNAGWGRQVSFNIHSVPNQPDSYRCSNAGNKARNIKQLKTVVVGADNQLYLTDGHHTFSAFYDMPEGGPELKVTVVVQARLESAEPTAFWQQMVQQGNAWLYDASGSQIGYQQLPANLGRVHLQNDPYRAALYFLRDGVWAKPKPAIPFVEFYWAQYLRPQSELQFPGYYSAAEYLQWLERIHSHLLHLNKDSSIFGDFTAEQLGWRGKTDYARLSQLLCQRKPEGESPGPLGIALSQRGMPLHCDKRQYLDRAKLATGLAQLPAPVNADGSVNVLIEIAAGSNAKWQQDKAAPLQLEWERQRGKLRQIHYLAYPANYGIVTNTLLAKEQGGDGDPLDVLVLGQALPQGTVQQVRLVAVMRMLDNGEQDDKLLAVPLTGIFSDVTDLAELQRQFPGVTEQLQYWFEHYKGAAGDISVQRIDGAAAAMALLKASQL
ncbi:Inorganic pyrophosphatase [Arsukibacterium tuosuense]|uniref:inorganic diphosphatase n=1 Tax=Arsukibacterium tuosuense TaxID=1323745 RepID=A0A285JJL5_9GAMM|nr:ParB-like protein [Arsukibacterium tuosuense]SNY59281.1 Inorganic pyrophosphatase [Arsukibacterium tuosuense]